MIREFDVGVDGNNHTAPFDSIERSYLQEIGRNPLLTGQEEILLSRRIRQGLTIVRPNENNRQTLDGCDPTTYPLEEANILTEAMSAKRHLAESNLRLVVSIAKRYLGRGMAFLDLVQEGNLGLMHATEKYDECKGFRFSTYATWWIRQAVTRSIADQARTVRLPVHMVETASRVNGVRGRLEQEGQRDPTIEEIAKGAFLPVDKVELVLRVSQWPLGLDDPLGDDSSMTRADLIADPSLPVGDVAALQALKKDVQDVLTTLTPRERRVLNLRYGMEDGRSHTLEQIGGIFGVTRERIRQIEAKALRKLKHPSRSRKLRGYLNET